MHGSDQKHESIHAWPPGSYGIGGECCSDTEQSVEKKIKVVFSPSFSISLTSQSPSTHHLQHLDSLDQCFSTLTASSFCSVLVPIPWNTLHLSCFHNWDITVSTFNPSNKTLKKTGGQHPEPTWDVAESKPPLTQPSQFSQEKCRSLKTVLKGPKKESCREEFERDQ